MKSSVSKKARFWIPLILKILLGILIVTPVIICILFSFKPNGEMLVTTIRTIFPKKWTLENYKYVLVDVGIQRYLKNTFIQCFSIMITQMVFCSLAAYAFVFYKFKGKKLLWMLILASVIIPADVVVIMNYVQVQKWHLTNTHLGMALPFLAGGLGIFLMRQFYKTIPKELSEAAEIDGCGKMMFFWKIVFPLSVPSLASLAIRQFVIVYNRYFWPLLVVDKDRMRTIQTGMAYLEGGEGGKISHVMAGASFCIIIPVIVFIFGQKYIVRGMTAGSVKG